MTFKWVDGPNDVTKYVDDAGITVATVTRYVVGIPPRTREYFTGEVDIRRFRVGLLQHSSTLDAVKTVIERHAVTWLR